MAQPNTAIPRKPATTGAQRTTGAQDCWAIQAPETRCSPTTQVGATDSRPSTRPYSQGRRSRGAVTAASSPRPASSRESSAQRERMVAAPGPPAPPDSPTSSRSRATSQAPQSATDQRPVASRDGILASIRR